MDELKTAEPGTVSHGTLRPQDLIPTFAAVLLDLVERNTCCDRVDVTAHAKLVRECENVDHDADDGNIAMELIGELSDALNEYAPDSYYFGAHPGDGSDFGFWEVEE